MDIIKVIQDNSLTVRCLPHIVTTRWSYREGAKLKDNQTIVFSESWNINLVQEVREVENGGWWYVKETKNTSSTVQFSRKYDKFFAPTLEEAIQMYLDNKNK
jgi:hypothetical protein